MTIKRLRLGVVVLLCFVTALTASFYLPGILFGEATIYSQRYSEAKFRSVNIGMSTSEVRKLLGAPLRIERNPAIMDGYIWKYSEQKTITDNFYRRWLVIRNSTVINKFDDFWFD